MKAFVYTKNGSQLIHVIMNVKMVEETKDKINFTTADESTFSFDKKIYKTTSYQN